MCGRKAVVSFAINSRESYMYCTNPACNIITEFTLDLRSRLNKSVFGKNLVNWIMNVSIGAHRLVQERSLNTKFDFEVMTKYC